jgi:sarcosine oxidase subunit beta
MKGAAVAIVGGGVIGCSVAYHLAALGCEDVVLFERGALAGGVTGVCPGGIRQQFEGEADCRLARHSVRFYERINDILEPEAPFFFERSGYLFLAYSAGSLEKFRKNVSVQNRLGIPSMLLAPEVIHSMLPNLAIEGIVGGSFCAEDGFIEDCHGVTNQLAARARERGASIRREHVRRLAQNGRQWTLEADSSRLDADHVVLAAGADSMLLASQVGLSIPIVPERRRIAYTTPCATGVLPPLVVAFERAVAAKQLSNGVLYLGWLAESPDIDDLTFIERTMDAGSQLLPILADVPVRRVMGGIYDNTPDRRPLLGPVNGLDGLSLAVGFNGHGFMIAPAVGEMVAAAVTGRRTDLPLAEFSLERFSTAVAREGLQI